MIVPSVSQGYMDRILIMPSVVQGCRDRSMLLARQTAISK